MNDVKANEQQQKRIVMLDKDAILLRDKHYWIWRRIRDIVLSLLGFLILWPLMLGIVIAILIESPGASPIFSQTRVGKNGKTFTFYKFRSMRPDAEAELNSLLDKNEMTGPVFKIKKDPRITKVGRFIRKASIDELPQLWNVLKGEMSLVGPRPALPREVAQYDEYTRQRLFVTPGLTCYWQIQPRRNTLSFDKWMELDIQYIQERSLLTDFKIILKTVSAVLNMNGV